MILFFKKILEILVKTLAVVFLDTRSFSKVEIHSVNLRI